MPESPCRQAAVGGSGSPTRVGAWELLAWLEEMIRDHWDQYRWLASLTSEEGRLSLGEGLY